MNKFVTVLYFKFKKAVPYQLDSLYPNIYSDKETLNN